MKLPRTVAHQAPLSMGFPRQEYWSELPFPLPEDLPNPETEPRSPALQADSLSAELPGRPTCVTNHWEIISQCMCIRSTYTPQTQTILCIKYISTKLGKKDMLN